MLLILICAARNAKEYIEYLNDFYSTIENKKG